jgi:hypothetical protein
VNAAEIGLASDGWILGRGLGICRMFSGGSIGICRMLFFVTQRDRRFTQPITIHRLLAYKALLQSLSV